MSIAKLRTRFKTPPLEYGPTPFLGLNDKLNPDRLREVLKTLRDKGCAGVFMHPRTGLEIHYLSEPWWERIALIVEECKKLGLKAWIYDEYNWPSGVAGGKALEGRAEFLMPYLEYQFLKVRPGRKPTHPGAAIAAFSVEKRVEDISSFIEQAVFKPPQDFKGKVLLFYEDRVTDNTFATHNAPWCSGVTGYLDLMNPDAVGHYMNLTHYEYEKRFKEHFGNTIPGLFTDEPQFYRGFPWSARFREYFRKQKGYDPVEKLYLLVLDREEHRKFRSDYYETAEALCAESFYDKVRQWCDRNGLIYTGHLGMEERLSQLGVNHGGIYRAMKSMTMPGIDALGDGNPREGRLVNMEAPHFSPRFAATVARAFGRKRVLCESGGGSGWQATPFSLKKQLDWLFASGVNFINPHHCLVSIKGLRKRDFPPFHGPSQPWFELYELFSSYIARLSMPLAETEPAADVLLYFPASGFRACQGPRGAKGPSEGEAMRGALNAVMDMLVSSHLDFDFLLEEAVEEKRVKLVRDKLVMGKGEYGLVIIPGSRMMRRTTALLLRDFLEAGGRMMVFGPLPRQDENEDSLLDLLLPAFRNAEKQGRAAQANHPRDFKSPTGLSALIERLSPPRLKLEGPFAETVLSRCLALPRADLYFLANQSDQAGPVKLTIARPRKKLEKWDPASGEIHPLPWRKDEKGNAQAEIELPAGGSALVVFREEEPEEKKTPAIFATNLKLLEVNENEVSGLSLDGRAFLETEKGRIEHAVKTPPLPITLSPEWEAEPEQPNVFLLGPWQVRCQLPKPRPIKDLEGERYYSEKTLRAAKIARALTQAMNLVSPPGKKYRTARYFDFGGLERMQRPVSLLTGINLERWGLYEATAALTRFGECLDLPSFMRSFPPPGEEYEAECKFHADYIPEDLLLVYEDLGEPIQIEINGKVADEKPSDFPGWDPACRAVSVAGLVKKGENRVRIKSRQPHFLASPPNIHSIEPFALMGAFIVKQGRIKAPAEEEKNPDWTKRGYPHYSGPMIYRCRLSLPEAIAQGPAFLTFSEVWECMSVKVNGKPAGARAFPPFQFEVTGLLEPGENEIEARVLNTGANFFHGPRESGIFGPIKITPCAEHRIELD